jgi:hypothetical protein
MSQNLVAPSPGVGTASAGKEVEKSRVGATVAAPSGLGRGGPLEGRAPPRRAEGGGRVDAMVVMVALEMVERVGCRCKNAVLTRDMCRREEWLMCTKTGPKSGGGAENCILNQIGHPLGFRTFHLGFLASGGFQTADPHG